MPGRPARPGSTATGGEIRSVKPRKIDGAGAVPFVGAGGNVVGEKGNGTMSTRVDKVKTRSVDHAEAMPEIHAWREVGWIFRDGDALAIERQGDRTRVRTASVCHLRDE